MTPHLRTPEYRLHYAKGSPIADTPAIHTPSAGGTTALARASLTASLIASVLGFFLWQTGGNLGVSPDSAAYLYAARSFAQGRGFLALGPAGNDVPLAHFPPLLPALLSLAHVWGVNVLTFALVMNCILCAASLLIWMGLIHRQTRSFATAIVSTAVAGASWTFLFIHHYVFSEPLFLFFVLLFAVCLAVYVRRPRLWLIGLAGMWVSLAFLARYVGLCLIPVGILLCLLQSRQTWSRRIAASALFLGLSAAGPLAWFLRNHFVAGTMANRSFALHFDLGRLFGMVRSAGAALPLPGQSGIVLLLPLAVIGFLGWRLLFRNNPGLTIGYAERCPVVAVLSLTSLSYLLLLAISSSTFDVSTPLDERILAPAGFLLLAVLAICAAALLQHPRVLPYRRTALPALLAVILFAGAIKIHTRVGEGTRYWRDPIWPGSPTLAACQGARDDQALFSNAPDGIWYLTDRKTARLPLKFDPYTALPVGDYANQLEKLCARVRQGSAVIVFFDRIDHRYLPTRKELEARLSDVEQILPDGAVFHGPAPLARTVILLP